ncbi:MAG: Ger(x)C family spore germination protein [Firmicutes bacterium]|nr:Ger(x)C family spore germination protein [Bacillota bacterium]
MRRLLAPALLLTALLVALTGCWDLNEIEDLALVQAIAIDKSREIEDGFRILVQVVDPSAVAGGGQGGGMQKGGNRKTTFRNYVAEGESILATFRELSHITSRRLFYAHTQVITISEDLARERGVAGVLDFLDRSPQIRRQVWLVISRPGMNEIFGQTAPLETTPAVRIFGIIEVRDLISNYGVNRLGDFLRLLQGEGIEPYTAAIILSPNRALPRGQLPTDEPREEISVSQTAVFKKDRLVGWLNTNQSRGLLWVRNEIKGGIVLVPRPDAENRQKNITLDILRSSTQVTPLIGPDGAVRFRVEVDFESNIDESNRPVQLNKSQTIRHIEELQNRAVAGEIRAALAKAQVELGADVFGFGNTLFHKDPAYWRQIKGRWNDIFPALEVEVHVKSRIRRTGLVVNPVEPAE